MLGSKKPGFRMWSTNRITRENKYGKEIENLGTGKVPLTRSQNVRLSVADDIGSSTFQRKMCLLALCS